MVMRSSSLCFLEPRLRITDSTNAHPQPLWAFQSACAATKYFLQGSPKARGHHGFAFSSSDRWVPVCRHRATSAITTQRHGCAPIATAGPAHDWGRLGLMHGSCGCDPVTAKTYRHGKFHAAQSPSCTVLDMILFKSQYEYPLVVAQNTTIGPLGPWVTVLRPPIELAYLYSHLYRTSVE
jgi:hypothetical protein